MDSRRGSRAGSVAEVTDLPSVEDLSRITKKIIADIDDRQVHDGKLPPAVTAYFESMMKLVADYVRDQVLIRKQPIDDVMTRCIDHIHGFIKEGDHFSALAFYQALNVNAYQDALNKQFGHNPAVAAFIKQYAPSSDPQVDYNKNYRLYENNGDPVAVNQADRAKVVVPYINHFVTMSDRVNTKIRENEYSASKAEAAGNEEVANGARSVNREFEQGLLSLVRTFAEYRSRICRSLDVAPEFPKKILLTRMQEAQLVSMTASVSPALEAEVGYFKNAFRDYLKNKDQPQADVKLFFALGNYMREKLGPDFDRLQAYGRKYESISKMLCDRKKFPFLGTVEIEDFCNALPPGERSVMSNMLKIVSKFNPATLRQSDDFEKQFDVLLKQVNQNLADYQNALKKEDMKKVEAVISGKEGLSGLVDKVRSSRSGSVSSPLGSRRGSSASPASSLEDTQSSEKSKSSKGVKSVLEGMRRDSVSFFGSRRGSKADTDDVQQVRKMSALKDMINEMNIILQAGDRYSGGILGAVKGLWTATGFADREDLPQPMQNIVNLFQGYIEKYPSHYPLALVAFDNHSVEHDELADVYNAALRSLAGYAKELGFKDLEFPQHLYSNSNILERVERNIGSYKLGFTDTKDPRQFVIQILADIMGSKATNGQKIEALGLLHGSFSDYIDKEPSQALAKELRDYKQALDVADAKESLVSKSKTAFARRHDTALRDANRVHEQEARKQEGKGWVKVERPNAVSTTPEVMRRFALGDTKKAVNDAKKAAEDAKVAEVAARAAELTAEKMNSGAMTRRREDTQKNDPAVSAATEKADAKPKSPSMHKGSDSDSE